MEGGKALYGALIFNSTLKKLEMDTNYIPDELKGKPLSQVRKYFFDPIIRAEESNSAFYCGGHTIGMTSTGEVYVWGRNREGQLGLGDTQNRNSPQLLPSPPNDSTWNSFIC